MTWLEFVASLVDSLAWPAALILLLFLCQFRFPGLFFFLLVFTQG